MRRRAEVALVRLERWRRDRAALVGTRPPLLSRERDLGCDERLLDARICEQSCKDDVGLHPRWREHADPAGAVIEVGRGQLGEHGHHIDREALLELRVEARGRSDDRELHGRLARGGELDVDRHGIGGRAGGACRRHADQCTGTDDEQDGANWWTDPIGDHASILAEGSHGARAHRDYIAGHAASFVTLRSSTNAVSGGCVVAHRPLPPLIANRTT